MPNGCALAVAEVRDREIPMLHSFTTNYGK